MVLGTGLELGVDRVVTELTGEGHPVKRRPRIARRLLGRLERPPAEAFHRGVEELARHVAALRRQSEDHQELVVVAPKERSRAVVSHADLVVVLDDRVVVVGVPVADLSIAHGQIVMQRVFPPIIEDQVQVAAVIDVVEPQTEARGGQSYGPDLGVLAVTAFGP